MKPKKNFRVFFNASVLLAALRSPRGASGNLVKLVRSSAIKGIISEIVYDEVERNIQKLQLSKTQFRNWDRNFFITDAPDLSLFSNYRSLVVDEGDIHLFVSAKTSQSDFLVSLDKKHVLSQTKRVREFQIVSPGELLLLLFSRR